MDFKRVNPGYVDVYILGKWKSEDLDGTLSLLLQLAHIIHLDRKWCSKTKVRLLNVVLSDDSKAQALEDLERLSAETRIDAECEVIYDETITEQVILNFSNSTRKSGEGSQEHHHMRSFSLLETVRMDQDKPSESTIISADAARKEDFEILNGMIRRNSNESGLIFMVLPKPHKGMTNSYLEHVRLLTQNLPPTILVAAGRRTNVIPQGL